MFHILNEQFLVVENFNCVVQQPKCFPFLSFYLHTSSLRFITSECHAFVLCHSHVACICNRVFLMILAGVLSPDVIKESHETWILIGKGKVHDYVITID